jgi:hypothetical protein
MMPPRLPRGTMSTMKLPLDLSSDLDAAPALAPALSLSAAAADAHEQMFGREPRDWSLLRLVFAAGLAVIALGVIAAVLPS